METCWEAAVPMTSLGLRCGLSALRLELTPLHQELSLVGIISRNLPSVSWARFPFFWKHSMPDETVKNWCQRHFPAAQQLLT